MSWWSSCGIGCTPAVAGSPHFEFCVPVAAAREIEHTPTHLMSQDTSQEGLDSVSLDELCTDERLRELPDDQLDMVGDHLKQMIPAAFDDAIQRGMPSEFSAARLRARHCPSYPHSTSFFVHR